MSLTRSRSLKVFAVAATVGAVIVAATGPSSADVNAALELDGNVVDASAAPTDWASLFTAGGQSSATNYSPVPTKVSSLPTGFGEAKFFRDFTPGSTADSSTFATGSKDTLPISPGWQCKASNNVTDKGDIQNTYMAAYRATNGHQIIYAGLEKNAPNGNNNMAVWLLQSESVACTSAGGNTPFTGSHVNGDVLLVAAFLNGGSNPQISAYQWVGGADGSLDPNPIGSGGKCTSAASNLCAITNDTAGISTPWVTDDKNLGTGNALQADQFYEMGADLTALGLQECFANYMANTRSSQELGATLYDFSGGSAHTCGSGEVKKYIDVDASGTQNTGDVTSGSAVSGWSFSVTNSSSTVICSGTTSTTGALVCSTGSLANLQPGTYTVTETLPSGGDYYNTDPGAGVLTKSMVVTTSGGSVSFGNTCYVDASFSVNKSTDASGFFMWYRVGSGTRVDTTTGMSGTGIKTLTINNTLLQSQSVSWGYGSDHGLSTEQTVTAPNSPISLASYGYSTCAVTDSVNFAPVTVSGTKYKDADANGSQGSTETGIGGFTFQLLQGSTVKDTTTSDSTGAWSFSNVAPGSYTVHELLDSTHNPNWEQTQPASNADYTVDIGLSTASPVTVGKVGGAGTATALKFGNAPLSKIQVNFLPQAKLANGTTDATKATAISCVGPGSSGGSVGSSTNSNTLTTSAIRTSKSQVVCTITFVDP